MSGRYQSSESATPSGQAMVAKNSTCRKHLGGAQEMSWRAACGLENACVDDFLHITPLTWMADEDLPVLRLLGIQGNRPFFPGLLSLTLEESLRLSFDMTLELCDNGPEPVSIDNNNGRRTVRLSKKYLIPGKNGCCAVRADGAMVSLGAAASNTIFRGRLDPGNMPIALMKAFSQSTTSRAIKPLEKVDVHAMTLCLYGTMVAYYLRLDLRISAIALILAEKQGDSVFKGFCQSLGDAAGSAFAIHGAMEELLADEAPRSRWLAARTSIERAATIASAATAFVHKVVAFNEQGRRNS